LITSPAIVRSRPGFAEAVLISASKIAIAPTIRVDDDGASTRLDDWRRGLEYEYEYEYELGLI
jgi:hypothetical protein